jgi:hypothetical protein
MFDVLNAAGAKLGKFCNYKIANAGMPIPKKENHHGS